MPGIFKKLSANDIKITSFEAHKQYNSTDLASIGAQTASLAWSGLNKSTFTTDSKKYYQIDKLYYRDYIRERAHRLELDDATYTTQERRLYQSASLLSLSQKTFSSEVQPNNFNLTVSNGGNTYTITDDGFGNLYDTSIGKNNFPNEDNRVFYLAPVNGFKRADLTLDIETGNQYVNSLFPDGYSRTFYDDSYFQNVVTYEGISFNKQSNLYNIHELGRYDNTDSNSSRIIIENRPYLNFNDEDFAISFYYYADSDTNAYSVAGSTGRDYILTKEGAQSSPPLNTNSLRASGSLDVAIVPSNPAYPYRVYVEEGSIVTKLDVYLERFDGENVSYVSGSLYDTAGSIDLNKPIHILLQKTGSKLQAWKNGVLQNETDDNTSKSCQNQSDLVLFSKRNSNGSWYEGENNWGQAFRPTQFQIWNQSFSETQIAMVSESFTGTYPIGNLFYDNGFAVLTHPKYMSLFDGGSIDALSYKNTHLITENEYQCTMTEDEFEFTTNISARKIPFSQNEDIANFATGSNFKPYITSVGLYDDNGNLLVVGKLGQPIKASSETDTTFVIRFDT
jgi:hypothetical protein